MDRLLQPVARTDFFEQYWEKEPLHVAHADPAYFGGLPGLDAVDELITATAASASDTGDEGRLVKTAPDGSLTNQRSFRFTGGVVDMQDIYRAYDDGYSVVINRLHCRSARFASMCRTLELDFHCPIGVNLYLSPANSQGFRPHVDTHDVLILQLHGTKRWHIAKPAKDLPLAMGNKAEVGPLSCPDTFLMGAGDVLYIPRGFPHEALTADCSSLHATVSLNVYRWVDLLHEMVTLLADDEVDLRRALAPGFLDGPIDTAQLSDLIASLTRNLHHPDLMSRAKDRLGSSLLRAGKAAHTSHFASIDLNSSLRDVTLVRRPREYLCRVSTDASEAKIEFPANFVAGPLRCEPAFRFIAGSEQFYPHELPGQLTSEEKIDLVERLISEGLLVHDTPTEGERHG